MSQKSTFSHQQTGASLSLAEEKARLDALFGSIGDCVIALDINGKIDRVNNMTLELLGFSKNELIGQWFPKIIVAQDLKGRDISPINRPMTQALLLGRPVSSNLNYRTKKGEYIPVAVTASPIMLNDKPIGAVQIFRDITKETEIDRMKSEFISLASHQLRTPATAVKQYLGLVVQGYAKNQKEANAFIKNAYECNEEQLQIIDDILNVAKIDAGKLELKQESINMTEVIDHAVAELMTAAKAKGHHLSLHKPPHAVPLVVDKLKIMMSIQNLISNAIKYTPDNGRIKVNLQEADNKVIISVEDNGIGIAKKDQSRLFKKFSRIENEFTGKVQGTGLGLYLVRQLIELHRGVIQLKSEVDKGTRFIIKLPKKES